MALESSDVPRRSVSRWIRPPVKGGDAGSSGHLAHVGSPRCGPLVCAVALGTGCREWQNPPLGFPGRRENRDVRVGRPTPSRGPWLPASLPLAEADARKTRSPCTPRALARRIADQRSEIIRGAPKFSARGGNTHVGEIGLRWNFPSVSALWEMRREQEAARGWG